MDNHTYWHHFVEWLASQPLGTRAGYVQMCIAQKGPCPDELGDELRSLLVNS